MIAFKAVSNFITLDKDSKEVGNDPYCSQKKLFGYFFDGTNFIKKLDDERCITTREINEELLKKTTSVVTRYNPSEKRDDSVLKAKKRTPGYQTKILFFNNPYSQRDIVKGFILRNDPKMIGSEFIYRNLHLISDFCIENEYIKNGQTLSGMAIDPKRGLVKIWIKNYNKSRPDILFIHKDK